MLVCKRGAMSSEQGAGIGEQGLKIIKRLLIKYMGVIEKVDEN